MPALKICPDCHAVPEPPSDIDLPGVAFRETFDEIHHADCPRVALSAEAQARVDAKIESSYRARGRAAAEARTAWVG
jgi:hypothetical protein